MAAASLSSSSLMIPKTSLRHSRSSPLSLHTSFKPKNPIKIPQLGSNQNPWRTPPAVKAIFDTSIFDSDIGGNDAAPPDSGSADIENERPECPPGLRQYETMVILRPNMSEDERLAFTHKYEQLLIAGGAAYMEVLNGGVIPLSYSIRKRNIDGETTNYLDGIKLLFTYFTKPESISSIKETLQRDDEVIRSSSFKIRKRKLFRGASFNCSM
ncbi:hypothetical protein ACS0TY_016830 [Phlomoides rotata]